MRFRIFSFVLMCLFSRASFSSESSPETDTRFGPGKAIEAFDKEQGFKLSQKAALAMGVSFQPLHQNGPWSIPKEAMIKLKQSYGVYRKYEDWISLVLVKILKEEDHTFVISSEDLEKGDEVAVSGANFLRMTDSDLNSGTVDSCAH